MATPTREAATKLKTPPSTPDGSAEETESVVGEGCAEVVGGGDGRADDGLAHEDGVEEEAAEEGAEGEEDGGGVGCQSVAVGHGAGDEWREDSHEQAGDEADDDAAAGDGAVCAQCAVGFADEDDGDDGHGDSGGEQKGLPRGWSA